MESTGQCKVYGRFSATMPDGAVVKLRIQDMPPDRFIDVTDILFKQFIADEPIHRSTGLYQSPEAVEEYTKILMELSAEAPPHVVICCEDNGTDDVGELLGASVMNVATEMMDLSKIPVQSKEIKKLFEIATESLYIYDPCAKHNVPSFFDDVFIVVDSKYRRLGIAHEFVKTRTAICREHNVPLAVSWMSAYGTQKAGLANGWETVLETSYEDLAKKHGVVFDNAPPTNKLMIKWANENKS